MSEWPHHGSQNFNHHVAAVLANMAAKMVPKPRTHRIMVFKILTTTMQPILGSYHTLQPCWPTWPHHGSQNFNHHDAADPGFLPHFAAVLANMAASW